MVSLHNPFRTPAVTPTPTSPSTSTPSPVSHAAFTPPTSSGSHTRTTAGRSSFADLPTSSGSGRDSPERLVNDILTDDLPPAYTPGPNVNEGEATLDVGPRRPFQQPVPVQSQRRPLNSWSTAGLLASEQTGSSRILHTIPRPSSTPISDFARDFFQAGTGDPEELYGGAESRYRSAGDSARSSSSTHQYAPPPGEPPNARDGRGAQSSLTSPIAPDDGRPTEHPMPGHPLMRYGKVLVYPEGYECHKCSNTGYKKYDPSHPCVRCWEKYAKPFAGALAYAPWSGVGPTTTTFQRPLPVFRAPQASLHQQSASWSGPESSSGLARAATTTTSRVGGYPGAVSRALPLGGGGILPVNDDIVRRGSRAAIFSPFASPPAAASWRQGGQLSGLPPSSGSVAVYPPGDRRIGGRLCWRCGGRGKTSFLIFDEETCSVCNGIGRTFV